MAEVRVVEKVWRCPECGLCVEDEPWRRGLPERVICRNGHAPVRMVLSPR